MTWFQTWEVVIPNAQGTSEMVYGFFWRWQAAAFARRWKSKATNIHIRRTGEQH